MNQQIEDKIVLRVLSRFSERSQVGITKYNTTLERTDLSTLQWLTHAQEEAMDFVLYLERLKDEYKSKQQQNEDYPCSFENGCDGFMCYNCIKIHEYKSKDLSRTMPK